MTADLATVNFPALGTTTVLLVADRTAAREAQAIVTAEIAAVDIACSRFRADSELSRLNAAAGQASSTSVRRWSRGGRSLHHVLDPATGQPADSVWRTVSVAARSCVDANIASTAAVIIGPAAPQWLTERAMPARLVAVDGTVVNVAGWPTGEESKWAGW